MWDHTAYCRRCKRRRFVAPRRYARAGDHLMMVATFGLWAVFRHLYPHRFGLWQCDTCGSLRCVKARRMKTDAEGNIVRKRKRKHSTGK